MIQYLFSESFDNLSFLSNNTANFLQTIKAWD